MEIVFNEFRVRFVSFVGGLGARFSGCLGPENRFENKGIFGDVAHSKPLIRRGGSGTDLGPENSLTTAWPDS